MGEGVCVGECGFGRSVLSWVEWDGMWGCECGCMDAGVCVGVVDV